MAASSSRLRDRLTDPPSSRSKRCDRRRSKTLCPLRRPGKQKLDGPSRASIASAATRRGCIRSTAKGTCGSRRPMSTNYRSWCHCSSFQLKPPGLDRLHQQLDRLPYAGDHVYLDKLALNGDAISLEGQEIWDSMAQSICDSFASGPRRLGLPVFKTVMGAASRQVALIRVVGTLSAPTDVSRCASRGWQGAATGARQYPNGSAAVLPAGPRNAAAVGALGLAASDVASNVASFNSTLAASPTWRRRCQRRKGRLLLCGRQRLDVN